MKRCAVHGRRVCARCWKFTLASTLGFLPEHLFWTKVPFFSAIGHFLGI